MEFFSFIPIKSLEREPGLELRSEGTWQGTWALSRPGYSLSGPSSFFFVPAWCCHQAKQALVHFPALTMIAGMENFSRKLAIQDYSKHRKKLMQKIRDEQHIRILNKDRVSDSLVPSQIRAWGKGKNQYWSWLYLKIWKFLLWIFLHFHFKMLKYYLSLLLRFWVLPQILSSSKCLITPL